MESAFSAINTTFRLAEFCLVLKEVESENLVFLKLIARVRKDLDEAFRERRAKEAALKSLLPGKIDWIDGAILDVRSALNDIGSLIERPRVDVEGGKSVTLKHRFEWVLMNHQKFLSRQLLLATCHQSLLAAVTTMESVPAHSPSRHLFTPEPEHIKMLPSPSKRRPPRKSEIKVLEQPVVPSSADEKNPVLPSSDEESAFCASLITPIFSSNPIEAGGGIQSDQRNLQDAPFGPSQPTPHSQSPPPSYSASWLPTIKPMSISWDEILSSAEQDEIEALSVAADVLNVQQGGLPAVSEMVDSLRRTATLQRTRRATAMFQSMAEGERKI